MKHRHLLAAALAAVSMSSVRAAEPPPMDDPTFSRLAKPPVEGDGRWKGNVGLGVTFNRGNNNSTAVSVNGDATRAMRNSRLVGRVLVIRDSSRGVRTAEIGNLEFRGERNFDKTLFGFGDALLERDVNNDLSARKSLSLGVGRHFVDRPDLQLNAYVGLAYVIADYYRAEDGRGLEPLVGEEFNVSLSSTSRFSQRLVVIPHTIGAGGLRSALQANITTRITDKFGLQVAALGKYRAHVAPAEKHVDITVFTGLTANF